MSAPSGAWMAPTSTRLPSTCPTFHVFVGHFIDGGGDKCGDLIEFSGKLQSSLTADLDNLPEELDAAASELEFVHKCFRMMGDSDVDSLESTVELNNINVKDNSRE
eukprot:7554224-Pyramimonas_sp.AAC.1